MALVIVASGCAESREPYRVIYPEGPAPLGAALPDELAERCLEEGHVVVIGPEPTCTEIFVEASGSAASAPFGAIDGVPLRLVRRGALSSATRIEISLSCDSDTPFALWTYSHDSCDAAGAIVGECTSSASFDSVRLNEELFSDRTAEMRVAGEGVSLRLGFCVEE